VHLDGWLENMPALDRDACCETDYTAATLLGRLAMGHTPNIANQGSPGINNGLDKAVA